MSLKPITAQTTMADLASNPRAYGLPTFEDFQKNHKHWMTLLSGRPDEQMIALSDGPGQFRRDLHAIKYKVHGKDLATEEEVERALGDHGFSLADIDLDKRDSRLKKKINMVPLGGGKYDIVVDFLP